MRVHSPNGNTDSLGLGLYVSRTLAKLMDGTLEYRREGNRTWFDLVLPAAEMGATTLTPQDPSSEMPARPEPDATSQAV